MILIILKSLLLGFLLTLPLGPTGIICLHRILELGHIKGFILGLSQTLAITLFSIIVIFSFGFISEWMLQNHFWFQLGSGLLFVIFGIKIGLSKSFQVKDEADSEGGLIGDFFSLTFLTLINPAAFLGFFILSAFLKLYTVTSFPERLEVIIGVFMGSFISWVFVSLCFMSYKRNIPHKIMLWINRSIGIGLICFGIVVCVSAFLS